MILRFIYPSQRLLLILRKKGRVGYLAKINEYLIGNPDKMGQRKFFFIQHAINL